MRSVLFVCTANICRSAYAEVVAASREISGLSVRSAGTHGWVDHPLDEHMATELLKRQLDPSRFRSQRLTRALIDEADLILTAQSAHRTFVLQERPGAVRRAFSLGQFAAALESVPSAVPSAELLVAARRERPVARAEEDIYDPYGRGPEAASEAAEHIDNLLDQVLPRLGEFA